MMIIYKTKNPLLHKYFKKGRFWQNHLFKGEFNRLGKCIKKDFGDLIKKRKLKK